MINIKDYAGQWIHWENGLRFKLTGDVNEYGEWIAENAKGHRWSIVPREPKEFHSWKKITEAEATEQWFDMDRRTIKVVACGTCCGWKCGKEEISFKMKLSKGEIPSDEMYRMQDAMRDFFKEYEVFGVLPYIHRTNDGIEISFIATREKEKPSQSEG